MIILQVADFSAPYGGNFIASLRMLSDVCARKGWRQVFVLPESARELGWCRTLQAEGQEVLFLEDGGSLPAWALALYRLTRCEGRVVIHSHFDRYDVAGWIAQAMSRASGRRVTLVWHAHSDLGDDHSLWRRTKNLLKYRVMGATTVGMAVAEPVRSQLLEAGCRARQVKTVSNGVDVARVTAWSRSREDVLRGLAIPGDAALVLAFGWDPGRKGVDTLLSAADRLHAEGVRMTLGLVGTEDMRRYVLERCDGGIPAWARLMPPIEQVGDYYHAAAVFVSASRREGLPYSVCEAMANGLPVVASDIPTQTFVRAAKGTVFFPVGSSAGLQAGLRAVLSWSARERAEAAVANRAFVAGGYDVAAWAEKVAGIYEEVAS